MGVTEGLTSYDDMDSRLKQFLASSSSSSSSSSSAFGIPIDTDGDSLMSADDRYEQFAGLSASGRSGLFAFGTLPLSQENPSDDNRPGSPQTLDKDFFV
jgi:hypothetical protein